ncbi:GNAT family N-acetyltransferase [bacterium]|nr:MAG: GNAT family N-acetyltransferase [bacterium]
MTLIRVMNIEDLQKIQPLIGQLAESVANSHETRFEQFTEVFTHMADYPEMYLNLVADQEGEVVGLISLLFYRVWFHPGGTALINELIVDRRYRSQGIGALLIDAAIKEARSRGMDEIEVGTEQENLGAQRFYRRCGFTETYLLLGMEFE